MRVFLSATLPGILLLASGCGSSPGPSAAPGDLGPRASVRFRDPAPRYGHLVPAVIHVANGSLNPILLRHVDLPGQLPDPICWLGTRPGRVRFDWRRGVAVWRHRGTGSTDPVFAAGLIYPGEVLEFERLLRFRGPSQEVVLDYQEVPLSEAQRDIFVYSEKATPRRRRSYEARFSLPGVSVLTDFRRAPPDPRRAERLILVPVARKWPVDQRVFVSHFPSLSETVAVAAAEVLESLGEVDADVCRWESGNAWLVRSRGEGSIRVHRDDGGAVEDYAGVEFTAFDLVDRSALLGVPMWLETPDSGGELQRVDPGQFTSVLRGVRSGARRLDVEVLDPETLDRTAYLVVR